MNSDEFQRTSFSGKANDNLLFQKRAVGEDSGRALQAGCLQHIADNQQVTEGTVLKGKMNKERLMCTAGSESNDITGTMAHYPHMEEEKSKPGK